MLPPLQPAAVFTLFAASRFMHFFSHLGLLGLFLVSIVDSSFVPLPIPGVTDVMIVLFAARHANVIWLVLIATAGSALGGLFSHMVGQAGGMAFLEKHVPARFLGPRHPLDEDHASVAVALPAILPPPDAALAFVLAAGALNMSRKRFMIAFTLSRFARHAIAAWLGVHYGHGVLRSLERLHRALGRRRPHRPLERHPALGRLRFLQALPNIARASSLRPLQNPAHV